MPPIRKLRQANNVDSILFGAVFCRNLSQIMQTRYDADPAAMAGNSQMSIRNGIKYFSLKKCIIATGGAFIEIGKSISGFLQCMEKTEVH